MPRTNEIDYHSKYSEQLPALGAKGQERLRRSRIHTSGTGRIGMGIILNLAAAGLGYASANDPQTITPENLGTWVFARQRDVGRKKVTVLARLLDGNRDFAFEPVAAPAESSAVDPYISSADLVISCANTVEGRLATECKAVRYRKPVMQVAAFDSGQRLGGLIALRLPENAWSACFACYLADGAKFQRGEGLLSTVTATLATVASNMAVQLITGVRADLLKQHNLFFLDLETYGIEVLAVQRRNGCRICGRQ